MKIYFEDGHLLYDDVISDEIETSVLIQAVIDAAAGINQNISALDSVYTKNPDAVVYTNSIFALNSKYHWNKEQDIPEVYIRRENNGPFIRIDKLTTRVLKKGHNLAKLYVAGEFDQI